MTWAALIALLSILWCAGAPASDERRGEDAYRALAWRFRQQDSPSVVAEVFEWREADVQRVRRAVTRRGLLAQPVSATDQVDWDVDGGSALIPPTRTRAEIPLTRGRGPGAVDTALRRIRTRHP